MNYMLTAFRVSRGLPAGVGIAIAILCGVGTYIYTQKKRSSNAEVNKEKDNGQTVHVTGADFVSASTSAADIREEAPSGADSNSTETAHVIVPGSSDGKQVADQALSDDRAFFQQIWELVDNEAKVSPVVKRSWYKSAEAMLRTKFRDSQPSTFETPLTRFMIFPVAPEVNVVFAEDREHPVPTVMFLASGHIATEVMAIADIEKQRGTNRISGQALIYVYEKCKELEQVRMGKIHPHLAYPEGFKVDGLVMKNHELKNRPTQELERNFFDRVFDGTGRDVPTITKMWSRSNSCFVAAAINRAPQPAAVRYQNMEGERFLHVMDPEDREKNLVLMRRPNGVVQIFRARSATESLNLSVVKGFEAWRTYGYEFFDFTSLEHIELAHYINQDIATNLFASAA